MRSGKKISNGAAVFFLLLLGIYANGQTSANNISIENVVDRFSVVVRPVN